MNTRTARTRALLLSMTLIAGMSAACSTSEPRSTVRETERVYRTPDEVCRETVVSEQRRDRDGDRTRVASAETKCRER